MSAEASGRSRIAILDYGMGNLRSAEKGLERAGASVVRTRDHELIRAADALVLPGDGAFPSAMAAIRELGFDDLLSERVAAGVPVLGICVGMQVLFDASTELGGAVGLGLLPGRVERLAGGDGRKLPHMGWSPVSRTRESPLWSGLPDPCDLYHVHSYGAVGADAADVAGTASYGEEIVSVVQREQLFGVQFHPEKSGANGLAMLSNFAALSAPARLARAAA